MLMNINYLWLFFNVFPNPRPNLVIRVDLMMDQDPGKYLDSCTQIGYPRWGFLKNFSAGTIAVFDSERCPL
jgi:hypothetical protein